MNVGMREVMCMQLRAWIAQLVEPQTFNLRVLVFRCNFLEPHVWLVKVLDLKSRAASPSGIEHSTQWRVAVCGQCWLNG